MNGPRIYYVPRSGVTHEDEVSALAAAYRFILAAYEEKRKGARPGAPDDAKESNHDRATTSIRRQQTD